MNKKLKNTIKYILFLSIGIFLFYLVYREFELEELENELSNINYWWILLAFGFGILSHISRAIRWRMLIKPLGYKPGIVNTIISVLILYFVNIFIPRGGELARCTVLNKYEKIPLTKLFGTVVTERIVDIIVLFFLVIFVLILQLSKLDEFIVSHPEVSQKISNLSSFTNFLIFGVFIALIIVSIFYSKRWIVKTILWGKVRSYVISFKEGILSFRNLDKKAWFIFHSLFIFLMYYLMFHVVFYSYEPTRNMMLTAGMSAFIAGGLAMLAPVQAGIGAWHFMVYETLFLFGIDKSTGKIFALISHTSTNLLLLITGVLSFVVLPLINSKIKDVKTN